MDYHTDWSNCNHWHDYRDTIPYRHSEDHLERYRLVMLNNGGIVPCVKCQGIGCPDCNRTGFEDEVMSDHTPSGNERPYPMLVD